MDLDQPTDQGSPDPAPAPSPSPAPFEDLATDQLGPAPVSEQENAVDRELAGKPEQQPSVSAPPPQSAPAPTSGPAVFEYEGRSYTFAELAAPADVQAQKAAQAFQTRAWQAGHIQNLYQSLQEQNKQLMMQLQGQQPQAPQQQPRPGQGQSPRALSADELRFHMQPAVQEMVSQGYVEQDFAEAFPNATASMAFYKGLILDDREMLFSFIQAAQQFVQQGAAERAFKEIDSNIAGIASRGDVYADAADPQKREAFKQWIFSFDPPAGFFQNQDWIAQMWFAYNHNTIASRVSEALKSEQQRTARANAQRRMATPVPMSARPAAPPAPQPEKPWDVLAKEALGIRS